MVIQENHRFTGPYFANEIEGASFSPDGKIFVTCSNDCTAKIWSRDGLLIRTLRDTLIVRDFMNGVVFSPSGNEIVTLYEDFGAIIWNIDGTIVKRIPKDREQTRRAVYSKDGEYLVIIFEKRAELLKRDGTLVTALKYPYKHKEEGFNPNRILGHDAHFSTDGKLITLAVEYFKYIENVPGQYSTGKNQFRLITFNTEGVVTSNNPILEDQEPYINFDQASGNLITLNNTDAKLWSAQGKLIESLASDVSSRLVYLKSGWRMKTRIELWPENFEKSKDHFLAYSPNRKEFLFSEGNKLWLESGKGEVIVSYGKPINWFNALDISPYNSQIGLAKFDGRKNAFDVVFIDLNEFKVNIKNIQFTKENSFSGFKFSPAQPKTANDVFFAVGNHNKLYTYNRDGKKLSETETFTNPNWQLAGLCFSSDGQYILVNNNKDDVKSYLTSTLKESGSTSNGKSVGVPGIIDSKGLSYYINKYITPIDDRFYLYTYWQDTAQIKMYSNPNFSINLGRAVSTSAVSTDGNKIALGSSRGSLTLCDRNGRLIKKFRNHHTGSFSAYFSKDNRFLITCSEDCTVKVMRTDTWEYFTLVFSGENWIIYTDDGYFEASKDGGKLLAMVAGKEGYSIDQFAVKYNRPDIILKRMGLSTPELIAHYEQQFRKRLRKLGLIEEKLAADFHIPTATIKSIETNGKSATVSFSLSDTQYNLTRYNIYVNDVPVFGAYGKPVVGKNVDAAESIDLTFGHNKIEVSCTNEKGTESYRAMVYATSNQRVEGDLYFLAFGVSNYLDQKLNLQFAHKDVADLERTLNGLKGFGYSNVYTKVLTNEMVTPQAIKTSRDFVKNAKPDDTFILFIAGHGMHDKDADATYYFLTYNTDLNNLKATAADFETIEDLLQGIPPRNKLFLMDACESGEIDEETYETLTGSQTLSGLGIASRGFKATSSPSTAISQPSAKRTYLYQKDRYIYNDLVRRSGAIVFSSSKGGELSYERSDLENGVFTEYLIKALTTSKADNDGDRRVSVNELKDYISQQVANVTNGLQNPTIDRDNIYQKISLSYNTNLAEGKTALDDLNIEMVEVKGGKFKYLNDKKANVPNFKIAVFEVTQSLWKAVMGNNPSMYSSCDQCPVDNVSIDEIRQFIAKLNQKTGMNYRLPNDAEWELAAKGGDYEIQRRFAGGVWSSPPEDYAWFKGNSEGKTQRVGLKQPNELGIYDMSGNVAEICEAYKPKNEPTTICGGSIDDGEMWISNRSYRNNVVGFRLALSVDEKKK